MITSRAMLSPVRPRTMTSIRTTIRLFTTGSGPSGGALRYPSKEPSKPGPGPSKGNTPKNPPREGDNNPGGGGRDAGHGGFPHLRVTQPSKPSGPKLDGAKQVDKVPVTPRGKDGK